MDIYYFDKSLTPHLAPLIQQLALVDGMPFSVDENFKCDPVVNACFKSWASPATRSPRTWKTYAESLSYFFRFLEVRGKTWREVTNDDLLAYYRVRRIQSNGTTKLIGARSWNVFVPALKKFYKYMVSRHHMEALPFNMKGDERHWGDELGWQRNEATDIHEKPRQKDIKYITEHQFQHILLPAVTRTREGLRNALFARLLMRSGLRADEAVTIRLHMLPDPDNPRYAGKKTCPMTIVGKGGVERDVRLPKSWLRDAARYIEWDRQDAIDRWNERNSKSRAVKHGNCGFLFLTATGVPTPYNTMYKMMIKAGRNSGLDFNTHPHMLRHSYAIYQLSAMVSAVLLEGKADAADSVSSGYRKLFKDPLRKLQRLMGHANITTTFIYLDYLEEGDDIEDITHDAEQFDIEDGYEDVGIHLKGRGIGKA